MNQEQKDNQATLDAASGHRYDCRCLNCRCWWLEMGPEDSATAPYGPFRIDEIEDGTALGAKCKAARLQLAAMDGVHEYVYESMLRPVSVHALPVAHKDSLIRLENGGQFGRAVYSKPLPEDEVSHFDLKLIP